MCPAEPRAIFLRRLFDYASSLRFPKLFALTAAALLFDLAVPDFIPFIDEILLGLVTLLLAMLKRRKVQGGGNR